MNHEIRWNQDLPYVMRASLGGATLAATATMLKLGPVGVVAGGMVGVVGAEIVSRWKTREQSLSECETHARSAIRMVVREATSYSREQVRHTAVLLRERLANQLRGLEAMLERAQAEASQPIDETTVSHSDREVLNRYRQKVLSITFNGDDR